LLSLLALILAVSSKGIPKETFTLTSPRFQNAFINALGLYQNNAKLSDSYDSDCSVYLQNLTNFFLENNDTLFKMIRNSGKDYNDLGRYDDCETVLNYRYILASITRSFPIPMALGMCVPRVCSVKDFNSFKPFLVTSLNDIMVEEFSGIKGFDPNLQLNAADLDFHESKVENEAVTTLGTGAMLTTLIGVLSIIGVIFSSVILWLNNKKALKLEEDRIALIS
jgi:hypothetical protein